MRIGRFVLLVLVLLVVGWAIFRSVRVENTPEAVHITVDKSKLRQAGHEVAAEGREAAHKAGKLLQRAGNDLDSKVHHESETPPADNR